MFSQLLIRSSHCNILQHAIYCVHFSSTSKIDRSIDRQPLHLHRLPQSDKFLRNSQFWLNWGLKIPFEVFLSSVIDLRACRYTREYYKNNIGHRPTRFQIAFRSLTDAEFLMNVWTEIWNSNGIAAATVVLSNSISFPIKFSQTTYNIVELISIRILVVIMVFHVF